MKELKATKRLDIRFSEVDSMSVVWHGSYPLYFEDAREAFGEKYGLGYLTIFGNGFYAPLVDLSFQYKKPIVYGMKPEITITYRPTEAAKIVLTTRYTIPPWYVAGDWPQCTGVYGHGLSACVVQSGVLCVVER